MATLVVSRKSNLQRQRSCNGPNCRITLATKFVLTRTCLVSVLPGERHINPLLFMLELYTSASLSAEVQKPGRGDTCLVESKDANYSIMLALLSLGSTKSSYCYRGCVLVLSIVESLAFVLRVSISDYWHYHRVSIALKYVYALCLFATEFELELCIE